MLMNNNPDISEIIKVTSSFRPEPLHQSSRRDAAVLIPLIQKEDGLHILFQVRDSSISQGGEVSFPGGRVEEGEDAATAAVRETLEELLLGEDQVELIAPLFQSIGPGGRNIFSFLGMLHEYEGTFSEGEVERIFTVPLSYFLTHEPAIFTVSYSPEFPEDFPFHLIPGGKEYGWTKQSRNICFYEVNGEIIWGMTAEILHEAMLRLAK